MKIISHKIKGVFVIKPKILFDKRGSFRRSFCKQILKKKKFLLKFAKVIYQKT